MTTATPRAVLDRAHAFVRDYDLRFADCFAANGVLELPFAPVGMPKRIAGRDAIRRALEPSYRAARAAGRKIIEYNDLRVHDTADPEVVIVEFTLQGAQPDGGRYQLPFIQVARVRGGEIVELRDYFDSLAMRSRLAPPPTTQAPSPRAVVEQLIAGVCDQRWDALPMLYAENTVVTHPFQLPRPTRLEGRDQLRAHFAAAAGLPITMQARNVVVHETTDPEVIVAEYDYLGRVTSTGRTFQLSNVMVMRIRDGQIITSHDYGNHAAFAEALGQLPALVARHQGAA
ncbi:MAG TPA: nuclear transport factor 2 family protein [Kofleriaceae bacterium]|jgi:ketosteroid isomerase-like protein|nr:nuclear transport factor 2 family protein [Kofleriaceae bacterium]